MELVGERLELWKQALILRRHNKKLEEELEYYKNKCDNLEVRLKKCQRRNRTPLRPKPYKFKSKMRRKYI